MAEKSAPGMEFSSWTSLPPGILGETLSRLKGPLLGMALQGLGVGAESAPTSDAVPPPVVDMSPVTPSIPAVPQLGVPPIPNAMTQLQAPTLQPSGLDQAREALRQQIKQSLGMK